MVHSDGASASRSPLSSALTSIFRGNLCDVVLRNRVAISFDKGQVIYDSASAQDSLFFIRSGFVKIGSVTEEGRELIYDVRKAGDVVGELCASSQPRHDRAVALEKSDVVPVPFEDVLSVAQKDRNLLRQFVQGFCGSLSDAYDQLNSVAFSNSVHRLIQALVKLAKRAGQDSGKRVEIPTYLTQEEIAQMVVLSRERVSTALNFLRSRGLVDYSRYGHLVLDLPGLENYASHGQAPA